MTPKGKGQEINLIGILDSLHMLSYYLPIHFMALNTTDKKIIEIIEFKLSDYYLVNAHKSLNYGPITPKILSARDFDSTDIYSKQHNPTVRSFG